MSQVASIRPIQLDEAAEWLRMRAALWPDSSHNDHMADMAAHWQHPDTTAVLVCPRTGDGLQGFIELSQRALYGDWSVERVAYIEGWYVDPDMRQCGIGRALVTAAEAWAADRGLRELYSDAETHNIISLQAHAHLGFHETERLVLLRKQLANQ
jgi:aminoglycoside 6'-N-acetyltransferase I